MLLDNKRNKVWVQLHNEIPMRMNYKQIQLHGSMSQFNVDWKKPDTKECMFYISLT